MHFHVHFPPSRQQGMAGILISGVVSAAVVLASAQNLIKSNMETYHAPNKVKIEVANQLMQSGLRYGNFLLNDQDQLELLMEKYKKDPEVTLLCEVGQKLPEQLQANKVVDQLLTPSIEQKVLIKAVFAPYDCDKKLNIKNFRLRFEILGNTGCSSSAAQSAEQCVTRSIVMTAYNGDNYRPEKSPPPPPAPPKPKPKPKPKPDPDSDPKSEKDKNPSDDDDDDDNDDDDDDDDESSTEGSSKETKKRTKVKKKNVGL